jgi:signal transduction histidine kinase/GAF domain-containing protein
MAEQRQRETAAHAHLEAATRRLGLLARAGAMVGTSLDDEATLRGLADILVPDVADFCLVDLIEADGQVRRVAGIHTDPGLASVMTEAIADPPTPGGPGDVAAALADGRPRLVGSVRRSVPWSRRDPVRATRLRKLGLRSLMIVPLVGRAGVLAAVTVGTTRAEQRYDEDDLAFAMELAHRAATAIENARLYRELARFKAAVDATSDSVLMCDPLSLRLTYINRGAVVSLDRPVRAVLRLRLTDLIAAQDEPRLREALAGLRLGSDPATVVATFRRRDGAEFPGEASVQLVEVGGAERLVTIVRDVSERVEARARLQRLAESERSLSAELGAVIRAIGDAVVAYAGDGRLVLANPAAEALLGSPPRSLSGLLARLQDADGRPPQVERLTNGPLELRLLDAPPPRGAAWATARTSITPGRWVETSASRFAPAGEPVGSAATETLFLLRDVTEARDRRLTREAFFGVLSHELRTPVTTIYGNSKLLARAARRSARVRTEALLDIESEAERLYRLVEDLLVLGRFEEGPRPRVGREPVLLQRVAPPIVAAEAARRPGLTFETRVPAGLPPVSGERTSVEQVLRNLVGNAAKYSPAGTITVAAEGGPGAGGQGTGAESGFPGGPSVTLRVLDEGPGLDEADPARLFELFYRGPDTARLVAGAGIGLFVSKRLVEAMGGEIWARSRSGVQGAEFGFTLPAFPEEDP